MAEVDITSFYDLIDHDLLLELIRNYFTDAYALELLERMLKSWSSAEGVHLFSHGVPQGPEASAFLADLFLYGLDKQMICRSKTCHYLRYVDDMRIFCKTKRRANAESVYLEGEVKKLGLVPNTTKARIINAKTNLDWLKEESSAALALGSGFMGLKRMPKSMQRLRHLKAKPIFMQNCKSKKYTPVHTYLARRSLPKLLPDPQVIQRITKVYDERPDLYDLFFMYLRECKGVPGLAQFCWKQLRGVPIRDWECANLIHVAMGASVAPLTPSHIKILQRYMNDISMPLAASVATGILFVESAIKPAATVTYKLPTKPPYLANWLVPILGLYKRRRSMNRPVRAIAKRLLTCGDSRTSFVTSYIIASKFSAGVVSILPAPSSPYSRLLLRNLGQTAINPSADEIAPLLNRIFRVKVHTGFDFRAKLGTMDPDLYNRALRHLQLASWYISTSPTHFVNHVHNFNHVLLHFALHSRNFVPKPIKWKHTFGELDQNKNPQFFAAFPTLAHVFRECSRARNTNLSSHPYAEAYSRSTKLVTYQERDRLISLLRAAYKEFMNTI